MQKLSLTILLGLALWALAAEPQGVSAVSAAEGQDAETPAKCLKAEVNPVTGHVLCIDPLGAPAEAPPITEFRCPENPHAQGDWTFQPKCHAEPSG